MRCIIGYDNIEKLADNHAIISVMNHREHFESLTSLVGHWTGTASDGHQLRVDYFLHADDSVLMEHWHLRSTDALTLYHLDGEQLMATHYCPLCNQPRLNLVEVQGGKLRFAYVSATNLQSTSDEHQHSFELKLIDCQNFWRSESYLAAGNLMTEALTYVRD